MTDAIENLGERVRHLETLETVMDHVKASTDAGQSIPSDGAYHTVIFEDEEYDTNAEYVAATGIFTAKRAGYLHVTSAILMAATTTWAANEALVLAVYVNGALSNILERHTDMSSANILACAHGSVTLKLIAIGDTVTVRVQQNSGAALALLASNVYNYVCLNWLF